MASYAKFDVWQDTQGITRNAVIQAVSAESNTPVTINTTTPTDIITLTITTKLAGSKLLILYSDDCNANANGAWKKISPYVDGIQYGYNITAVTNQYANESISIVKLVGPFSLGEHLVAIKAYQGNLSSTFHEETSGGHVGNLTVLEIAQ